MNNFEASIKDLPDQHIALLSSPSRGRPIAKILVACDQKDTAPVGGYILRQQGLVVMQEA